MHVLEREAAYPRSLAEVFGFFADAGNLEVITPPWLRFKILTPLPIAMRVGAIIDYQLTLRRLPIRWRTEITAWEPPHRFVDEQRRGPYRLWRHEHTFREEGNSVRVRDRVQYAHLGGPVVQALMVAPELRRIFDYRMEVISAHLG